MTSSAVTTTRLIAIAVQLAVGASGATAAADEPEGGAQLGKISVDATEGAYTVEQAASPKYTEPLRDTAQTIR